MQNDDHADCSDLHLHPPIVRDRSPGSENSLGVQCSLLTIEGRPPSHPFLGKKEDGNVAPSLDTFTRILINKPTSEARSNYGVQEKVSEEKMARIRRIQADNGSRG